MGMPYFTIESLAERDGDAFPELREFLYQTNQGLVTSLWDVTGPFEHLCRSKFVSKFFEMEVRNVCADPAYDGQNQDFELDLFEAPSFKLAITQHVNPQSQAHELHANEMACYAVDFLTCNLGPGTLEFQIYETPDTHDNRLFDRSQKPSLLDQRRIQAGEVIAARAGKDMLRLVDSSPGICQMHCVSATVSSTLVWHYDVATLEPLYCTAGNQMSSRLEIAIAVLARMADAEALCESAWNKAPVLGVIGIQSGPPEQWVHSGFHRGDGSQVGDAGSGDDREDPSRVFRSEEANQDDLPRASGVAEGRAQGDPVAGDRVSL
jgi:hypothetical protein